MKYTILGFQQEKLIKYGLKIDDAQLLRVIKDMYSSASMEFIIKEDKQYMWVNQRYLLEQIPILGSRRKMLNMIDKYVELGLVEKILKHDRKGQKGNYSYLRPTIKLDELTEYTPYAKVAQGLCRNSTRVMQKLHNKDTSIIDTSIKDNKDSVEDESSHETPEEEVLKFNKDSKELKIARFMRKELLRTKEDSRVPNDTIKDLQGWAQDIDYIIRIDKRDPRMVEELFTWAQEDDFWTANVRSPSKLRKQWDTLEIQMKRGQKNGRNNGKDESEDEIDWAERAGVTSL